jgi:hypothetical protein
MEGKAFSPRKSKYVTGSDTALADVITAEAATSRQATFTDVSGWNFMFVGGGVSPNL